VSGGVREVHGGPALIEVGGKKSVTKAGEVIGKSELLVS
jgi:hypothetical protein